jgi:hypothetical protein
MYNTKTLGLPGTQKDLSVLPAGCAFIKRWQSDNDKKEVDFVCSFCPLIDRAPYFCLLPFIQVKPTRQVGKRLKVCTHTPQDF